MPISQLPALILSVILVGYSPGPCNIFALAMVLRHGRRDALRMWFGMVAGYLLVGALVMLAAHLTDLACGSRLHHLLVRHRVVTDAVMALALVACAALILAL